MDMQQTPPPAGHNNPPVICPAVDDIRADLLARYPELAQRRKELLDTAATIPDPIPEGNEDLAKKVSDFLAMCRKFLKVVNGHRESEKAPYLAAGVAVDGFFKAGLSDDVEAKGKKIRAAELVYIDNKATRERLAREEQARQARAEADRLAAAALAAENARIAEQNRLREVAAAEQAERERVAKLTANPNQTEPVAVPPPPPAPPPLSTAPAEAILAQASAAADRASELERSALAKPASMGRVRGDLGGVSTIRKMWTGEVVDRTQLDLEALRQLLPQEGLEQAVRAFAKMNGVDGKPAPVLKGARIYQKNV